MKIRYGTVAAAALAAFFLASNSGEARAEWVDATTGNIPGGEDGKSLYVCRAFYQGGIHPGKIQNEFGGCNIGYGGKEVRVPSYAVLTARWVGAANGNIPPGAFAGGEEGGQSLFVCRATYQGGIHPGKIRDGFGGCNIGYGGREVTVASYQALVGVAGPSSTLWMEAADGIIPADALAAGREGADTMYVCQADHQGGIHPGKIRKGFDGCNIGWGGKEVRVPSYSVLTMNWAPDAPNGVAVVGGNESDGQPLYLCRARHQGGVHPGKTRQEFGGCNIGWGGAEVTVPDYTILLDHPAQ
jgi:hypothetical protein